MGSKENLSFISESIGSSEHGALSNRNGAVVARVFISTAKRRFGRSNLVVTITSIKKHMMPESMARKNQGA